MCVCVCVCTHYTHTYTHMGFPGGLVHRESSCDAGDTGRCEFDPWVGRFPGEGHATHSSPLAWKIPWTEEPGGLPSIGSQRVGHD